METFISVSGFVVGIISLAFALYVFYKSSADLKNEAEDLRRLSVLMIRALAHAGLADIKFDATGKPTGLKFILKAEAGHFEFKGNPVTLRRDYVLHAEAGHFDLKGGDARLEVTRNTEQTEPNKDSPDFPTK